MEGTGKKESSFLRYWPRDIAGRVSQESRIFRKRERTRHFPWDRE